MRVIIFFFFFGFSVVFSFLLEFVVLFLLLLGSFPFVLLLVVVSTLVEDMRKLVGSCFVFIFLSFLVSPACPSPCQDGFFFFFFFFFFP